MAEAAMIVAMPHCGARANSTSGGEVTEREILVRLNGIDGINAHVFSPSWPGLRWWNSPAWFAGPLRACVRWHRPALVRIHSLRYVGPAALVWGRQIPTTAHFHHLDTDRLAWLDRLVLGRVDQVTTDSEFSRRQAAALGVRAEVIRLGVDHIRFSPTPRPEGRVVLLVGGTKLRKNTAFVRRLWPDLLRWVPDATLLEIGQGCAVADQLMSGYYRVARVVAFPSRLEGFGLPVLEAMACGRPVLCSDCGALPELGAQRTVPLDPSQWIAALVELLTSDEAWQAAAEANYVQAQGYAWESTASALATAWRSCTRRRCL